MRNIIKSAPEEVTVELTVILGSYVLDGAPVCQHSGG